MNSTDPSTDLQYYLESCSPAGLTLVRFELVDDVAELTPAFTPEALERVLRAQLRATGAPSDWDEPGTPTEPGSPTWAYAMELAELLNEHYFKHLLLERHERALETILMAHGLEGTPIVIRPPYAPRCLALILRRLKAEPPRGNCASATHAA